MAIVPESGGGGEGGLEYLKEGLKYMGGVRVSEKERVRVSEKGLEYQAAPPSPPDEKDGGHWYADWLSVPVTMSGE